MTLLYCEYIAAAELLLLQHLLHCMLTVHQAFTAGRSDDTLQEHCIKCNDMKVVNSIVEFKFSTHIAQIEAQLSGV
jgi:hypothetical protein